MIILGMDKTQKENIIKDYLSKNSIKKVYVFYFKIQPDYNLEIETEYIEYADIEMYKFFYRLLEEIDNSSLIVIDECMRTQNRSELIYNCAHHYLNQTQHKIIFEYLPFIEDNNDFMILLDFQNKGKYKGKSFDYAMLKEEEVIINPIKIKYVVKWFETTEKEKQDYEKKKNDLFDNLGSKHPDTIPRTLHISAGNLKKSRLMDDIKYVARNSRFKKPNVVTYKEVIDKNYTVIDYPCRRLEFVDYLRYTKSDKINFLSSDLKIDKFYADDYRQWLERMREFYAQAGV